MTKALGRGKRRRMCVCSECKIERKHHGHGLCYTCYNRYWRSKHPGYSGEWRRNNLETFERRRRASREKNPEYDREYASEYGKKNRAKITNRTREYRKNNRTKIRIQQYTRLHNKRTGVCSICGIKSKTHFHHSSYVPNIFKEVCARCHRINHRTINIV